MLYKKYHRTYLRKFKKGTKITIGIEYGEITEEPSIYRVDFDKGSHASFIQIRLDVIPTCREDTGHRCIMNAGSGSADGKVNNEWIRFD